MFYSLSVRGALRLVSTWLLLFLAHADAPRLLPFQGRLLDSAGKPIPNRTTVVRFQIFDQPTGGTPVWAGELHRVTVNGGLVNVVLGSKNPLPMNHPGDDTRPFFGSTLYLEATPDTDGDEKVIEDPPLSPRQAILPVVFAAEAGAARDSRKLNGRDWSDVLADGATDPRQAGATFRNALLGANAVTTDKILDGNVLSADLGDAAVQSRNLAAGSVTDAHLEANLRQRIAALEAEVADLKQRTARITSNGIDTWISMQPNPNQPNHTQYMAFQWDGHVVIYRDGNPIWFTGTAFP